MSMKTMGGLLAAGLMVLLVPGSGVSQEENKPKRDDSRTVTKWVAEVAKPGLDSDAWEKIGEADNYDDAVKLSEDWYRKHPESKTRMTRERKITVRITPPDPGPKNPPLEENTVPKGGVITKPDLKTVDPGAIKWDGKGPNLTGKTGTGTIGRAKVTVRFTGDDKGGRFAVSGDLNGGGDWRPDGRASVYMETENWTYRGVLKGDALSGQRFSKKPGDDGKNDLSEWRVTLLGHEKQSTREGVKNEAPKEGDSPKGPYKVYYIGRDEKLYEAARESLDEATERVKTNWAVWKNGATGVIETGVEDASGRVIFKLP